MRVHSSFSIPLVLLIVTLLINTSALLQSAGGAQPRPSSGQGESLRPVIDQLLRQPPSPLKVDPADALRAEKVPPADDAQIEELVAYWSRRGQDAKSAGPAGPSDIVRERLLSSAERRPWILPKLYNFLPQNTDAHDRLYETLSKDPGEFDYVEKNNWRTSLYRWLQSNTQYLRDELIEAVDARDNNDSDKLDDIEALAKLDWPTAKPLLEKIVDEGRSVSYPTALSLLYEGVMKGGDASQAEAYREILKGLAVERGSSVRSRRTALESLLKDEWTGQEEWFVSLFGDPNIWRLGPVSENVTLIGDEFRQRGSGNSNMSFIRRFISITDPIPLSKALSVNPGKWIPVVVGLTGHKEAAVRSAAVSSLAAFLNNDEAEKKDREESARALLPWLTNPDWAPVKGRADFIFNLVGIDLPESVPGLLWILDNDKDDYTRGAAIMALTRHCDSRAATALKVFLQSDLNERRQIVTSLAKCGAFSDDETASAIEAYDNMASTDEGQVMISEISSGESEKTLPPNVFIGQVLLEGDMSGVTEGSATILFDRLKEAPPAAAKLILDKIRFLPLNVARIKLVERIGDGSADLNDLMFALWIRETLVDELRVELSELVKKGGYAGGIAAVALVDRDRQVEILKGKDAKAQIALLAGARYVIEKLPIELLKDQIAGSDKTLAQAVEDYLVVEGGADARKLILARRPNELKILGDLSCLFAYQSGLGGLMGWEEKLRGEVSSPSGVEEIYALAPAVPSRRLKGMVIRVRRGNAEISVYDVVGGQNMRLLSGAEFRELKDFT